MRTPLLGILKNTQEILVMDGGQGTELENRGMDISGSMWSTMPFTRDEFWDMNQPCRERKIVRDMYRAYLDAGAQLLSSITYQASFKTICGNTPIQTEAQYHQLLNCIVNFCRECIGQEHYLVGSIGSYAAHVGAEYTGDYGPQPEKIDFLEYFRPQLTNFNQNDNVDIIAIETVPNFQELEALLSWDESVISKPFYVSLCVDEDGKLHDGTPLRRVASLFPAKNPNLVLMGINCCKPSASLVALAELHKTLPNIPLIVYPNSGEIYDHKTQGWSPPAIAGRVARSDTSWQNIVPQYKAQGARVIGGCCRTIPKDICCISRSLLRQ